MGRPTRQASRVLSRKILRTARQAFLDEGFVRTTTNHIAEKAAISKRTLYSRYTGKSALFETVILTEIHDRLNALEQDIPDLGNITLDLVVLAEKLLSWMLSDVHVAMERVVLGEATRFPALTNKVYEFGFIRTTKLVVRVLQRANEKGEIAVSDPDFAAEQFVSAVILSPFRRAALGITEAGYTPEIAERMDRSVNLFVYGCRPSVADSPSR